MPGLLVLENIDGALFCEHCGSYVELPDAEPLRCSSCEASCSFAGASRRTGAPRPARAVDPPSRRASRPRARARAVDDAPPRAARADSGLADAVVAETRTAPKPRPKWARGADDDEYDADAGPKKSTRATVEEECPECGHPVLEFYTMQMRSVDEGQTVFYECLKCRHKFSQNN
ncbi:RNA polymerase I subunit H [Aureococcus anophagefferens]|uniref:DNA-directed RNA polymerase I subunit RPA12 n=1 Tax=Aureococcus anophagefferens TaxID=44056 RepID=A0ABR1FM51_AURAN